MSSTAARFAARWLVRDTFRQARASGVFWLMLAVTLGCVAACLSVTVVEGVPLEGTAGRHVGSRVEWANGLLHVDVPGDRAGAVRAVQTKLAGGVADAAGLLLALLWTAGLLPAFLEPSAVTVLLAKPVPRWALLAGKCLGALLFVGVQALAFVAGTWLALGLRTGVWDLSYWLCLPLLLLNFAVFFSFSALLAVATRSTVACVFGSVLFWLLCWAMNFGRHAVRSAAELNCMPEGVGRSAEIGYWLLPKPLDFHLVLSEALQAAPVTGDFLNVGLLAERGLWSPVASLLASALFAAVLLGVAAYDFLTAEY
jgi:ABC-type transport system involved in multi-copper enzyme maturation permease subunit